MNFNKKLILIIIIFAINIFINRNVNASNFSWDLNTSTEYTLSDNTKVGFNYGSGVIKNYFIQSDIIGDSHMSIKVDVGDLDGDGDLDIYVANYFNQQNDLWINDGLGNGGASFTLSNIIGDNGQSWGVDIGDIDNDGDLDIYTSNLSSSNRLWINDGLGNGGSSFTASDIPGDTSGTPHDSRFLDIDSDGDLDIYVANDNNQQNKLWINDGLGNGGSSFTASDIPLDIGSSGNVSYGDIDSDGDLDIYVANGDSQQNKLWINDGLGNGGSSFTLSNISGDIGSSVESIMEDLDGDGDLDIYTTNIPNHQNKLWINDGLGNGGASFTASDITGDTFFSNSVSIGDLDRDNDLDIYIINSSNQNKLWINDGLGNGGASFTASDITGDTGGTYGSSIGDLDGDGNLDIYVAGMSQNNLWINEFYQDSPYLVPNTALTFTKKIESFTETLGINNEGTINYQVSTDNGVTWYYWDGLAWIPTVLTDGTETSPSSDINTNIKTLNNDGGSFTWRAYLNSNGDQKVELDQIDITFDSPAPPTRGGGQSGVRFICKDPKATNYNPTRFGRHKQSFCIYEEKETSLDTKECPHFTKYFEFGDEDEEVKKIQIFLQEQGINTGYLDSIMGPITFNAIKQFQNKYFNEILKPWSLTKATGRWYQSTRHKANELAGCSEGMLKLDNGVVIDD